MKHFNDAYYAHAKRVRKDLKKKKKIGEYYGPYVQNDTLLLVNVFDNFWSVCLEIYELLDVLTDIEMLLIVEKDIRGGICHSIYRYVKANNKYMTDYDKNKESSYLQ